MDRNGFALDVVNGLVAGAAATQALVSTGSWMYAHENDAARKREEEIRKDAQVTPLQKPVRRAAEALDVPLSKEGEERVGNALAWTMSIAGVVAYAAARRRFPAIRAGRGLAFGAATWLLEDELMMWGLGLTPPPQEYPWQAHARGLATHLAHGVVAELALEALDAAESRA